jgi:hypothetical protein
MVAWHGPERWPGMLRNQWPAWAGIRIQENAKVSTTLESKSTVIRCGNDGKPC